MKSKKNNNVSSYFLHNFKDSTCIATDDDGPPACDGLDSDILGYQTLAYVNPYIFPCAIEFALIGACFFIAVFASISAQSAPADHELHKIKSPNPETFFSHRDHRNCFKGSFIGGLFLLLSLISLGIYVAWTLQGNLVSSPCDFMR